MKGWHKPRSISCIPRVYACKQNYVFLSTVPTALRHTGPLEAEPFGGNSQI